MQPAATVCDEPSAESLWGDLAGLNLAGYDDWDDEELQQVDVEAVVAQLVSCDRVWPACTVSCPAHGPWGRGYSGRHCGPMILDPPHMLQPVNNSSFYVISTPHPIHTCSARRNSRTMPVSHYCSSYAAQTRHPMPS